MTNIRVPTQGITINLDGFNLVLKQLKEPKTIFEVSLKLKKDPKTMRHYFKKLLENGHVEITKKPGNRVAHYKGLKDKIVITDMAINVGAFKKMVARKEQIRKEKIEPSAGIRVNGNVTTVSFDSYHTKNDLKSSGKSYVSGSTLSSYL